MEDDNNTASKLINNVQTIIDKFDKVLENYELDKKFGQMSVDSICHLFPAEMLEIKEYIRHLEELCNKYEEQHSNEFQCWKRDRKELLDKIARIDKAREYINKHIEKCNIDGYEGKFDNFDIFTKPQKLLDILEGKE